MLLAIFLSKSINVYNHLYLGSMPPKFPNLAKLKARTKSGGEEAKKQVTISKFFLPSKTQKQSEESKETAFVVGDESPTPSDKASSVLVSTGRSQLAK